MLLVLDDEPALLVPIAPLSVPLPVDEPLSIDPVEGIAPGVPDCIPEPPPMLPLGWDAPMAPLDCATAAAGASATAAAIIISFLMFFAS